MRQSLFAIAALVLTATVATGQSRDILDIPSNGVTWHRVLKDVKTDYTPEARAAGIQGIVMLEAIVLPNGTVGDVKVIQSLDTKFGLDNQAVKAAKQWRFKPGAKDGEPVAVRVF